MTNGDPEVLLMHLAWRRLWKPGTPYYLPAAIVNGARGNAITVTPLGQIGIADLNAGSRRFPIGGTSGGGLWGGTAITDGGDRR